MIFFARFASVLLAAALAAQDGSDPVAEKLEAAGLAPSEAQELAAAMAQGYSPAIDALERLQLARSDPRLVPVWKDLTWTGAGAAAETAFWLSKPAMVPNEWRALLEHRSACVALAACRWAGESADAESAPILVRSLSREEACPGEVSTPVFRAAAEALLLLSHSPIEPWEAPSASLRKEWQDWFEANRKKPAGAWREEGEAQLLRLLDSEDADAALRGVRIALRLEILSKAVTRALERFSGVLKARIEEEAGGKLLFVVRNEGSVPAIVAFASGRIAQSWNSAEDKEKGGGRSSGGSPYLPLWRQTFLLRPGERWSQPAPPPATAGEGVTGIKSRYQVQELLRGRTFSVAWDG